MIGNSSFLNKIVTEAREVNGIHISGICCTTTESFSKEAKNLPILTDSYEKILNLSDAIYIHATPGEHYRLIRKALKERKHVLCESPLALKADQCEELFEIARANDCVLIEAVKTAYATAFNRLILLLKSGKIGKLVSIEATCTSLREVQNESDYEENRIWNSITGWGPTALLPVFMLLGVEYDDIKISSLYLDDNSTFDVFSKIDLYYSNAVASIKVGTGVKSETLCVSYYKQYGVKSNIVRPGHIYGPTASMADSRVSSFFAYAAAEGKDLEIKSEGKQIRSYCYVLDCASAIITVLLKGKPSEVYNISNENSIMSIKDIASLYAEEGAVNVIFNLPSKQEKSAFNPMENSSLDNTKLRMIGWKGLFDSKMGTSHTIKILRGE